MRVARMEGVYFDRQKRRYVIERRTPTAVLAIIGGSQYRGVEGAVLRRLVGRPAAALRAPAGGWRCRSDHGAGRGDRPAASDAAAASGAAARSAGANRRAAGRLRSLPPALRLPTSPAAAAALAP